MNRDHTHTCKHTHKYINTQTHKQKYKRLLLTVWKCGEPSQPSTQKSCFKQHTGGAAPACHLLSQCSLTRTCITLVSISVLHVPLLPLPFFHYHQQYWIRSHLIQEHDLILHLLITPSKTLFSNREQNLSGSFTCMDKL